MPAGPPEEAESTTWHAVSGLASGSVSLAFKQQVCYAVPVERVFLFQPRQRLCSSEGLDDATDHHASGSGCLLLRGRGAARSDPGRHSPSPLGDAPKCEAWWPPAPMPPDNSASTPPCRWPRPSGGAPQLRIVPPRFAAYRAASAAVMERLTALTPLVEQISIDEAFLDVTALCISGTHLARELQQTIQRDLGLPCSLGVAAQQTGRQDCDGCGQSAGTERSGS